MADNPTTSHKRRIRGTSASDTGSRLRYRQKAWRRESERVAVVSDQQTSRPNGQQASRPNGASTAELVSQAASQISTLVRDELALGRAELMEKGKRVGLGGGLLGAAGVLAIYGFGVFLALAVVVLDLVWPLWLAVLVVLAVVLVAAALAAFVGKRKIDSATPAVPTETADRIKADVQVVKDAFRDGRRS